MRIQKIRSISEAVAQGILREVGGFDGVRDMVHRRWDWFHSGRQMHVGAQWPAESVEKRMMAIGGVRRSINRWIRKHGARLSEMKAPPHK